MKTTWLSWLLAVAWIVSPVLRADDAIGLAGEDCPDAAQSVLAGDAGDQRACRHRGRS